VAEPAQIGLLTIEVTPSQVVFRFANPHAMMLEIPVSLEEELARFLEEHRGELEGKRFLIDLQNLPALSSRQLGMMLTVRKLCQSLGTVELEGLSGSVRHLLHMTRMARYFNLPAPPAGD